MTVAKNLHDDYIIIGGNVATDNNYSTMTNNPTNHDTLLSVCKCGMQSYGMSDSCITTYMHCYRHLLEYMEKNSINRYSINLGEQYCSYLKLSSEYSKEYKTRHFRAVTLLDRILSGKPYTLKPKSKPTVYHFAGDIGEAAKSYIQREEEKNLSLITINQKRNILSSFSTGMQAKGKSLCNLTYNDVLNYISCLHMRRVLTISILKGFTAYLYAKGLIAEDMSADIASIKTIVHEKIISYYTQAEVSRIENSIDRRTKNGKRNYAMILLSSRLGLRASDVTGLKFDNIDWDNNQITLQQYKTKRIITLPLLAEVGEAIIDYILYARPKTVNVKNVFVSNTRPHRPVTAVSFSTLVQTTIRKSGVSTTNRHAGAHCLRHSLATSLMNEGTDFPVISDILGHESTKSTMFYLGVNVRELLECSLPVPAVPDSFYMQKGGVFYE